MVWKVTLSALMQKTMTKCHSLQVHRCVLSLAQGPPTKNWCSQSKTCQMYCINLCPPWSWVLILFTLSSKHESQVLLPTIIHQPSPTFRTSQTTDWWLLNYPVTWWCSSHGAQHRLEFLLPFPDWGSSHLGYCTQMAAEEHAERREGWEWKK